MRMLHDGTVPGHGRANVNHILVGPGGVTVVDSKAVRARVRTGRKDGLFSSRPVLSIDGRDRTALAESVDAQIECARGVLRMTDFEGLDVRGALCFPYVDGLPVFQTLWVGDVMIDGPKRVAKLARRKGKLAVTTSSACGGIWIGASRTPERPQGPGLGSARKQAGCRLARRDMA